MASALHDRTNSDSPNLPPSKMVRRVQSSRLSHFHLDSEDTFSGEHSSIYDAPLELSDHSGGPEVEQAPPVDLHQSSSGLPLSPCLENLDQFADLPSSHAVPVEETAVPTSHSNWPTVKLETIAEQRSLSTLHTSVSLPRLTHEITQHFSVDGKLKPSTPSQPPNRFLNLLTATQFLNRRSFSENDTTCLRFPVWKGSSSMHKECQSDSSSSSSEELLRRRCIALWPVYPLKPRYPPLERPPTPPGLPRFGTREAVELLRVPSIRGSSTLNSQRRPSTRTGPPVTVMDGVLVPARTPNRRSLDPSNPKRGKSITTRIIRSLCRSSSEGLREAESRRVGLPSGFVARADDGTLVRGRFGVRNSGHGVGARTGQHSMGLEGHPFHRLEPAERSLEEEIREIDKACEAAERTRPPGVEGQAPGGVVGATHNSGWQRPPAIDEYGRPSIACARRWSGPINETAPPAQEATGPRGSQIRVIDQAGPVRGERTMLQRRMSAQNIIVDARLEDADARRRHGRDNREAYCCNWMRGWCNEDDRVEKQEAQALFQEDRRIALRRSPHMLESEEPVLPNARLVYPTPVSEEVAI